MKRGGSQVNCPLFQKQEPVIRDITVRINEAKDISTKAIFAEELQKEVEVFLDFPEYDEKSTDCANCRFISNARHKTASLITKANNLI